VKEEITLKEIATKTGRTFLVLVIVLLVLETFTDAMVEIIKTMWGMAKIIFGG